ncbi:CoA transferase [Geoglobus acetivorans]|uniref:CoA transferase n=1 Tax=Geoglobus acetivorans TaxID=565033 RepID=A0ABZ3H2L8_GEOAI|nr:CoA transferase [Geoglobus acetivorans]
MILETLMLGGMAVIELAYYYPGPFCCKILSDLGARVVKIEPPSGDPMRYRPEIFAGINAGKELLRIDLKTEEGRDEFYRLVEGADVVVEGFRPGVAKKLGVDYETLSKINEGLIYCSITGFGQNSEITRPVHDINVLAMAGICEVSGLAENTPKDPNVQFSDYTSSVMAAISILSAYIRKMRTGRGAYIDVNMYDSALFSVPLHAFRAANGKPHLRDFYDNPGYRIYRAKGCHVSIGILDEPVFWERFCRRLGLDEFAEVGFEERLARADEIEKRVAERLSDMNKREIEDLFGEDIPYGIIEPLERSVSDFDFLREVEFENTKVKTFSFPVRFHLR